MESCCPLQVLQLLLGSCEGEEDVRGVVAECLGHTALLAPGPVLGMLRGRLGDASAAVRAAVAAAPRAMVVRLCRSPPALLCASRDKRLRCAWSADHVDAWASSTAATVLWHDRTMKASPKLQVRLMS